MSASLFESVRLLVETQFKADWASRSPVKYGNSSFDQPRNSDWVTLSLRWGDSEQASLGPTTRRLERHAGVIVVQVFVPKNSGEKLLNEHLDFAAAIFRMQTIRDSTNGIELRLFTPRRSYAADEKELRQENLIVPFQADGLF